jgi:tetratricopeptide (TPR) repeat protein
VEAGGNNSATGGPTQRAVLASAQQDLQSARFDAARERLDEWLDAHPDDVEALYLLAVACRYARRFDQALDALARLKARAPEHGRAHQEEGHLLRALDRGDEAIAAYARACQYNPALAASHRYLIALLQARGRAGEASHVQARLDHLLALPKPLVAVTDLIAQGQLVKAEELCRQFLLKVPDHVEGMRLLAGIGMRLGVLHDAEFLLDSAVQFAPDNIAARIDYVTVLRKRQKFAAALAEARSLLEKDPSNPQLQSIYAIECIQSGNYAEALEVFDNVLAQVPGDPVTLTSRGHALKTSGRYEEAVASYRSAISSREGHGEAWYSLANLKTFTFSADDISRLHRLHDDTQLSGMERVYVCFALGKAYEDQREYQRSFEFYALGNAAKRRQSRYDADQMHEELNAQREVVTAPFLASRQGVGDPAPDPIFIVGLPRAGSTLLEQILSSHSQIDGTLELPNVLSLAQSLRRRQVTSGSPGIGGYPAVLSELSAEELREFGNAYIDQTRVHRAGAPRFIDKMPNNFRHIGLIHLMLPNAKIIDARREPMACCFSGFKQLFAEGQEFSYSLTDIGRYYRDYVALMEHWDDVLPGKVLRVMHEDVVDDLEGQVRRILAFLGVPFEAQCLRYWETERAVRTPSSEQVRKPIFRDSVEQWRHYAPWLGELRQALGPLLPATE